MAKPAGNIVEALERHLIPAVTEALRKAIRDAVREIHAGQVDGQPSHDES
jgi:hypothetical protein